MKQQSLTPEQAQRLTALHEELRRASDPEAKDPKVVEQCVREIRKILGYSSAKLAGFLGVSDQTVLRWQHQRPPYDKTVPSEYALIKLRELIESLTETETLPDKLPAAYFRAVANTERPALRYLKLLVEAERLIGAPLDEETCGMVLRAHEKSGYSAPDTTTEEK